VLFLLDANSLIDAKRDYYGIKQVPEFWDWLIHKGKQGYVKIPVEVWEEFADKADSDGKKDELASWSERTDVRDALLLDEEAEPDLVDEIVVHGYASDLTDDEIYKVGRDPFLISYALADAKNHTIVSTENSRPSAQRANRKVPDVCAMFGVRCINNFQFFKELNFRTDWARLK